MHVENSTEWQQFTHGTSGVVELIIGLAADMVGWTEPRRFQTWVGAWDAANSRIRRRWLRLLKVDVSRLSRQTIAALELVEVPRWGRRGCRPDLAILDGRTTVTRVLVVTEDKSRALAQINCPLAASTFGVDGVPEDLRDRIVDDYYLNQLDVYRTPSAWRYVYPAEWDLSDAVFALVTPEASYSHEGWARADSEAVAILLLGAAASTNDVSAQDAFARAVAAQIAASGSYPWRAIPARGKTRSYKSGLAASWAVWLREVELVYLVGAPFGLTMSSSGWMPVDFDRVALDPAALADAPLSALALDVYAAELAIHQDRVGWMTCTFVGCLAPPDKDCGHVSTYGWPVSRRPPPSSAACLGVPA